VAVPAAKANPFRIGGTVSGRYFTDRAAELKRIAAALSEPQAKLLVYGPRRMGKSSAIESAARRARRKRQPVVVADLSAATALADVASRILQAATRQLSASWKDVVVELVRHLKIRVSVLPDPATGQPTVVLDVGHRAAPIEEQRVTLAEALDAIDRLGREKGRTIGVVLDEFQEIHRFGGENAEWHLRGVIQSQEHVSYVLAGSKTSLIQAMTQKNRAFYKLFELLRFGPIDEDHLARWIDSRMESHGVRPDGAGRRIVELARPRTRDIVQLARTAFQVGAPRGRLRAVDVERALDRVVDEEDELIRSDWDRRTALQQNVLRAVAAREEKLFSEATCERYGLRGSAYVASALDSLIDADLVVKLGESDYDLDSPFMRRWVVRYALPDVGILDSRTDA
jgi:AAA+ ATPase superfamily predicted ATPase